MRQAIEWLRKGIRDYCKWVGLPAPVMGHYVEVNEERARAIARAYEALPKVDRRAVVEYMALKFEVARQWDYAVAFLDIKFEAWTQEGQPYANSCEMQADVRDNRHLWYFAGGEVHPVLGMEYLPGVTYNDAFRAVHDLFGHAAEGYQFGPRGEENAWLKHSQMFSPLAQRALTTETRGQNSWVNFGPHSHLPVTERPFAEQKMALLPVEYCDWQSVLEGDK